MAFGSVFHRPVSSAIIERTVMSLSRMLSKATLFAAVAACCSVTGAAHAQSATEIQLSYKDKKFTPAEITAPANTRS